MLGSLRGSSGSITVNEGDKADGDGGGGRSSVLAATGPGARAIARASASCSLRRPSGGVLGGGGGDRGVGGSSLPINVGDSLHSLFSSFPPALPPSRDGSSSENP